MFQKNSFSIPSDSSNILLVKVIQTRRSTSRKHAKIGKFLKVVIRNTKTKLRKVRKKKSRAIAVRTSHIIYKKRGRSYFFSDNALILLKTYLNPDVC